MDNPLIPLPATRTALTVAGVPNITSANLQNDPKSWRGITWGIVEAFVKWLLAQGYFVATVNNRLSSVKTYAKLASKVGAIDKIEYLQIRDVSGYAGKEAKRINDRRDVTRIGDKKKDHVSLTPGQAKVLKTHDLTKAQGRRDALLMCLLLDHGLRVGEAAGLDMDNIDLSAGEIRFYRPKVDKEQTHKLTADTLRVATVYIRNDSIVGADGLLLGSIKGGWLTDKPMSSRAITARVRYLGEKLLGLCGLMLLRRERK